MVGCFGDNLDATATKIAGTLDGPVDLQAWRELGVLINYNGYGAEVEDLHFNPATLYRRLLPYASPSEFLADDRSLFETLQTGYAADMAKAESATRMTEDDAKPPVERTSLLTLRECACAAE